MSSTTRTDPNAVQTGTVPTVGVWTMVTETSTYIIDLDARTALRLPGEGAGPVPGLSAPSVSVMRLDTEAVPLLMLPELRVGEPAVLWLDVRKDGVLTRRETTIVRSLEQHQPTS